jgi:murein DD-endopeptidase MepM/ murein hydrolase activator NlpD
VAYEQLIQGGGGVSQPWHMCWEYGAVANCYGCYGHAGIDIYPLDGQAGHLLFAIGYGTVVGVGVPAWAGTGAVVVSSGDVMILYAHNQSSLVSVGDATWPGRPLATVGCQAGPAASCTGNHVHFQVNPASAPDFASQYCSGINPVPYLFDWPGAGPAPQPSPQPQPQPGIPGPASSTAAALLALGGVALGGLLVHSTYGKLRAKNRF